MLAYRRGRGVLDGRDPFSVTPPLGRELWGEADAVLAVGTRLLNPITHWGVDKNLGIVRVDADREEPARLHKPKVALIGDAAPILRKLIDELDEIQFARAPRAATKCWSARPNCVSVCAKLAPQLAFLDVIRAELPEDGIYVDDVTQIGFAARLAFPVYKPRTFLSPGYQDNLGWGFATALGAQHARPRRAGALGQWRRRLPLHRQRTRHRHAPPHSAGGRGVRRRRLRQCAAHPGGATSATG